MHTMLICNHECFLCTHRCTHIKQIARRWQQQCSTTISAAQLNLDVTACSSHSYDALMEANPKEQVLFSCKHSDEDEVLASAASEGENAKVCCLLI